MSTTVSVIMSLYRPDERYLAEQLDSIDDQAWDDMEVVIWNDDPTDIDRYEFCKSHVTRHKLRYYHGEENRGYVKAFEHLIQLAQGELLAFSDQDDRWLPNRIQRCVAAFDADSSCQLVVCDRQVIDSDGKVVVESWRASHPNSPQDNWKTGDRFVAEAAFTCYAIGMATMVRRDAALACCPFPICTGHDKWLALCCGELGTCAYVEEPLVQYRRHGSNVSGAFSGVASKSDWYEKRPQQSLQVVKEFAERFPDSSSLPEMLDFAQARVDKKVFRIWKGRKLAPDYALFEICLAFTPDWLFRLFVGKRQA